MRLKAHRYCCNVLSKEWQSAEVSVDAKGAFRIGVPQRLQKLMARPQKDVTGSTLAEVTKAFDAIVRAVEQAAIVRRRIIACRFEATLIVDDARGNTVLHRDDISFQTGAAVAFACNVLDELEITGSDGSVWRRYEDVYTKENHPFPYSFRRAHGQCAHWDLDGTPDRDFTGRANHKTIVLPWSQALEDFFAESCKSFCALAMRLDQTFTGGSEKVLNTINQHLLEAGK